MSSKKSFNFGTIFGLLVAVFCLVGCCMVFLPLLTVETSGTILGVEIKGVTNYPGLGVIFGGTHSVTSVIGSGTTSTSAAMDVDFKFNIIGFLAVLLPLVGAILVCLNGFLAKKIPFYSIVGLLLIVVGLVLCFFIPSGFKAVNDGYSDVEFKYGIGLILMIVFFGIACVATLAKLFLADFKK
jgi:hypothetical protein